MVATIVDMLKETLLKSGKVPKPFVPLIASLIDSQMEQIMADEVALHQSMSITAGMVLEGLRRDHDAGYGGPGLCGCFAPTEGDRQDADISSERVHSGDEGDGQEHTDGSPDVGISPAVEGLLVPDSGHEAEVSGGTGTERLLDEPESPL